MTNAAQPANEPNPGTIFDALNAYQRSAALKAAIELDIFTQLSGAGKSAEAIAAATNASLRGIRILCDYLAIGGFLAKHGTEYSLTSDSAAFLDRNSPAYFGSTIHFLLDPRLISPYLHLTDVVRSGRTTLPDEGTVSPENPLWIDFARHMAPMVHPAALELASLVAGGGEQKVLDIAAGHGLFGITIAQRNAKARITALDWANVLTVAKENAERFGVSDRHSTLAGDAFEVEFGGPFDLVLVTNFFHHFDPAGCEQLMRKIFASLAPGGRCATLEFIPNEDRVSPPIPASFAMMMLGTTASGDAYTFKEYESMFRNAGFASSKLIPLTRSPQAVILSARE